MKPYIAPAKINLYLHVTGKRPDGYHLLDSLMVTVGLHDVVRVGKGVGLTLDVTGGFADIAGIVEDNIVIKAAKLLADEAGVSPDANIALEKNIPVGAGMGGGSADAATVLKALNEFWDIGFSEEKLMKIGLQLGADVPFCVAGKPAFVSGVGEVVKDAGEIPKLYFLLVNPMKVLPTAEVFRGVQVSFASQSMVEKLPQDIAGLVGFLKSKHNHLEEAAIKIVPEIVEILGVIGKQDGCLLSRMSGSGATCFGIFASKDKLDNALAFVKEGYPKWWVNGSEIL